MTRSRSPRPWMRPRSAFLQESLTNVVRHAAATAATVRIRYGDDDLTIQIDDDGEGAAVGPPSTDGGSGIAGMRERVTALGGQLDAGSLPGRGFRVRAQLPVHGGT